MKTILSLLPASLLLLAAHAVAGPEDYMHTPVVEQGETEFGVKYGRLRSSASERQGSAVALGIGHTFTAWWSSEIYLLYDRSNIGSTSFDAFEWENTFQLTPTGRYTVEVGFLTELERPQDRSEGYELIFGPLFQKDFGALRGNLNILFTRQFDTAEARSTEIGYQFQARYKLSDSFGAGMQAFGEMGKWNNWAARDAQSHRVGPAVFGSFALGEEHRLVYDAAILFETAGKRSDTTLRAAVSYEF